MRKYRIRIWMESAVETEIETLATSAEEAIARAKGIVEGTPESFKWYRVPKTLSDARVSSASEVPPSDEL